MAGRHIEDPQSVDTPLSGSVPEKPKAALVKDISNFKLPEATIREIEKAGSILSKNGWLVEEVEAPEVERVVEIWGTVLSNGLLEALPDELFKPETAEYLRRFCEPFITNGINLEEALIERRRLRRLWSSFLTEYTVCIGPTWSN